ncbi:MAG TPA: dephospho-CoA kinase [Rhizomicrobium sp.]
MPAKRPLLVGLTGSIGMGKSETAKMFAELGVPVYDADAAVHRLYEPGGAAVAEIAKVFPDGVVEERVDRARLGEIVAGDPEAFRTLEGIVHPLVAREQQQFLQRAEDRGADMVVLDIPLLFETGGHARMDAVVVVSAPEHVQRERVLARAGMTPDRLTGILGKQMPDAEKRAQAQFVIETDKGLGHALEQVRGVVRALRERAAGKRDA